MMTSLAVTHLSSPERNFVARARADLMKFNDVAEWVLDEDLIRIDTDQTFDLPVPNATILEFFFRFLDVLDGERNVWQGWIFFITARHWRSPLRPHEVNLRRPLTLADVHPKPGNRRNIGAVRVGMETEHVGVKRAGFLDIFWRRPDADTVMMELNNFY
jgi:hypothetical protein